MVAGTMSISRRAVSLLIVAFITILYVTPALAEGYDDAFRGIKSYRALFDVSTGDPKVANLIFWAVKNSYEAKEVKALGIKPDIAVVFHGPVVKLVTTNRDDFNAADWAEVQKFQETLRQMKKDGVKLEVCLYAAKVLGIEPDELIPEVHGVGNGFVSIIGYQQQGYGVVRIP